MTAPVSQVLSEAADLLAKPGAWGQGMYEQRAGCMCALGALARASHVSPYGKWDNVSKALPREAATLAFGGVDSAIEYNDAEGRTQLEVVDALRRAAALAKEQGL